VVIYVKRGNELLVFDHRDHPGRPTLSHFYRVDAPAEAPDSWEHNVTGHGEDEGLVFLWRFDSAPTLWPVDAVFLNARAGGLSSMI
jgi:hypothetical protein